MADLDEAVLVWKDLEVLCGRGLERDVMDQRKLDEVEFHDTLRAGIVDQRWSLEAEARLRVNPLWRNLKYYSIERKSTAFVRNWLQHECPGRRVLDYGCGNGEEAIFVARHGARHVTGIDISSVAIENCKRRAVVEDVASTTDFRVNDGEELEFDDNSFDLAMEYGVLHHVDLDRAMHELARVLKPHGKIICTEALGHNPVIQLYRHFTPQLRTRWEVRHILRKCDLKRMGKYFGRIERRFFHLATLGAVPFRDLQGFGLVLGVLEAVDEVVLRLPFIRWQAWQAVFVLSEPIKSGFGGNR